MKLPFKFKGKKVKLTYKFLCKTCDIFFYNENANKNKCPVCGHYAQVYDVQENK